MTAQSDQALAGTFLVTGEVKWSGTSEVDGVIHVGISKLCFFLEIFMNYTFYEDPSGTIITSLVEHIMTSFYLEILF